MDRRKLILYISLGAVIVLLVIIIIMLILNLFKSEEEEIIVDLNLNQSMEDQISQLPPPSPERVEAENNYPLGVKPFSLAYAERFASYSSDAGFKHLDDLRSLSTANMRSTMDIIIANSSLGSDGFEAQEARALNSNLLFSDGSQAIVVISLQLSNFVGDKTSSEITYEKLELKLIQLEGSWQVDEASWQ